MFKRARVKTKHVIGSIVGIVCAMTTFLAAYGALIAAISTTLTLIGVAQALILKYSTSMSGYQDKVGNAIIELSALNATDYAYEIEIQNLEDQKTAEEDALALIEQKISGINVNIGHEQSNIAYCNYMLSQQLSGSTADHWIKKRKEHRKALAGWQSKLSSAEADKAMKESSISSLGSQIFTKKFERSHIQEEISRVSSNIVSWTERIVFIQGKISGEQAKLVELTERVEGLEGIKERTVSRISAINTELEDENLPPATREQLESERSSLFQILYGP